MGRGDQVAATARNVSSLAPLVERYAFTPEGPSAILKNVHGDSSGVRGAAWLWHRDEVQAGLPQ